MIYFALPDNTFTTTKPADGDYNVTWVEVIQGTLTETFPEFTYRGIFVAYDEPVFVKGADGVQYAFTFRMSDDEPEFLVFIARLDKGGKVGNIHDYYEAPQQVKFATSLEEVQLYFEQLF